MSDVDPRLVSAANLMDFTLPEVRGYISHLRRTLGRDVDDDTLIEQALDLMRRERQRRAVSRAREGSTVAPRD